MSLIPKITYLQSLTKEKLAEDDCPFCRQTPDTPILAACGHMFCLECLQVIATSTNLCPCCRVALYELPREPSPPLQLNPGITGISDEHHYHAWFLHSNTSVDPHFEDCTVGYLFRSPVKETILRFHENWADDKYSRPRFLAFDLSHPDMDANVLVSGDQLLPMVAGTLLWVKPNTQAGRFTLNEVCRSHWIRLWQNLLLLLTASYDYKTRRIITEEQFRDELNAACGGLFTDVPEYAEAVPAKNETFMGDVNWLVNQIVRYSQVVYQDCKAPSIGQLQHFIHLDLTSVDGDRLLHASIQRDQTRIPHARHVEAALDTKMQFDPRALANRALVMILINDQRRYAVWQQDPRRPADGTPGESDPYCIAAWTIVANEIHKSILASGECTLRELMQHLESKSSEALTASGTPNPTYGPPVAQRLGTTFEADVKHWIRCIAACALEIHSEAEESPLYDHEAEYWLGNTLQLEGIDENEQPPT